MTEENQLPFLASADSCLIFKDEDTKVIDAKPNLGFLIIMDGFRDVLINIRFRKDISKSIKFS